MYQLSDIKWVKNIKRENGTDWAYMEDSDLPEFDLHFSIKKKASANTAKSGEIIVLFQRVDKMDNVEAKTYITHLVSPIDNTVYSSDRENFPVYRRVKVIARGDKEKSPNVTPEELSFFKPNRGAVHDIRQLNESKSLQTIQKEIWSLFEGLFIQHATIIPMDEEGDVFSNLKPKIIFNNFKVFKGRTEINLAPITVLTGQNSIGKSSIMKGLMLLSDYVNQADRNQTFLKLSGIHAKKHRLNAWGNVKNWYNKDNKVTLEYTRGMFLHTFSFAADDFNVNGQLKSFSISHPYRKDKLELTHINEGIYEINVSSGFIEFYNDPKRRIFSTATINTINKLEKELEKVRSLKVKATKEDLITLIDQEQSIEKKIFLFRDKIKLERNESDLGVQYKQQFDIFDAEVPDYTLGGIIGDAIYYYTSADKEEAQKNLEFDELNDSVKEEGFKMESKRKLSDVRRSFSKLFKGQDGLTVQHLSPVRATQTRLFYQFDENNEFQKILHWYSTKTLEGDDLGFFERWMNDLGIGTALKVFNVEGEAYIIKVWIKGKEKPVDLADLGYGVGQVLSILLAILKNKDDKYSYLMIEEPEANLHPKLQSLLAEMVYEASWRFKTNFIIETHSEYLIRKWQTMVAKDHMPKEQVIIYYLEDDKGSNVVPRRIEIEANGKLSEEFGKGFFDEATRNAMELFQYRNKK